MDSDEALHILGLREGASWEQIRQAYRDLAKVWHPDRFGSDARLRAKAQEQMKIVNEAYQWLQLNYEPVSSAEPTSSTPRPDPQSQSGPATGTPDASRPTVQCPYCYRQTQAGSYCQHCGKRRWEGKPPIDSGRMIMLLILNALWNGFGNVVVGDRRGWRYALYNVALFAIGFFTVFVPVVLFYVYCAYEGYQYLNQPSRVSFNV